ncbi:hypothetical protein [Mucilaginibacter sp. L196]|uniref:hypothetical protein n=1 Tax=Mucilaginibacter sp. L196 TaxID=1641870 RepID=UPI00131E9A8B|nr:hypothetical protein [Mucilaginibacter sp. L196]
MKYLYLFVTLIFLTPLFSSAQNNYKPGYVVTLKGDTLKGYIDYKEWIQNPRGVNFKTDAGANQTSYSINNCSAFGANGFEYYRRYILPISQDKVQVSNLTIGVDTTTTTDTVFLKTVTSGKNITLLTYNDGIKRRFFVAENNAVATELIQHLYLDPQETSRIVTQKTYTRQLQQLAAQYQPQDDKLIKDIPSANYSGKDIRKIVYEINGATNYETVQSTTGSATRFFAGIALNDAMSRFTPPNGTSSLKSSSAFPQITFGTDILVNKNVGDLLVRLEIGATGNKANYAFSGQLANSTTYTTFKYTQYQGFFNPQLLYNFYNTNASKVYVAIGFQLNYATYANKSYATRYTLSGGYSQTSDDTFPDFKPFVVNLTSKIGYVIGSKLDIYLGYNPSTNINDNEGYSLNTASFKVGINYLFGAK